MKKKSLHTSNTVATAAAVLLIVLGNNAYADTTPKLRIAVLDSVSSNAKYVTLDGYTNPACEDNRMLIDNNDAEYRKDMFAMLLSAFHASTEVSFFFTVSGGQCHADRVLLYK